MIFAVALWTALITWLIVGVYGWGPIFWMIIILAVLIILRVE